MIKAARCKQEKGPRGSFAAMPSLRRDGLHPSYAFALGKKCFDSLQAW